MHLTPLLSRNLGAHARAHPHARTHTALFLERHRPLRKGGLALNLYSVCGIYTVTVHAHKSALAPVNSARWCTRRAHNNARTRSARARARARKHTHTHTHTRAPTRTRNARCLLRTISSLHHTSRPRGPHRSLPRPLISSSLTRPLPLMHPLHPAPSVGERGKVRAFATQGVGAWKGEPTPLPTPPARTPPPLCPWHRIRGGRQLLFGSGLPFPLHPLPAPHTHAHAHAHTHTQKLSRARGTHTHTHISIADPVISLVLSSCTRALASLMQVLC